MFHIPWQYVACFVAGFMVCLIIVCVFLVMRDDEVTEGYPDYRTKHDD